MRGRARLVFSAVTMGGICAALFSPGARLVHASVLSTGPSNARATHKTAQPMRLDEADGWVLPGLLGGLPQATTDAFVLPAVNLNASAPPAIPAVTMAAVVPAHRLSAAHGARTLHRGVPRRGPVGAVAGSPGGAWSCIRDHESGGNYATDTGNGYYGAYQFSEPTWHSLGGTGYPNQASPAEQDAMAQRLQQRSGWGQWSTHSGCGV